MIHHVHAWGAIVGVELHMVLHFFSARGAMVGVVLLIVLAILFAIHVRHKWKYMYGSGGGVRQLTL